MSTYPIPRIMLAAPNSGAGKTTLTCALLQALVNRGLSAASFKCGPDYIDPMFHSKIIGIKSRNLDLFFLKSDTVRALLYKTAVQADIAVLEGVMGYYDGVGGTTTQASSYELARETKTPVVLVVNCGGMSLSLAALIKGFLQFREDSGICGVILNRVSPMLYPSLKKALEEELGIAVLGYLPPLPECSLQSRHLGLVTANEVEHLKEKLNRLAAQLEHTMDFGRLIRIAQDAPPLSCEPIDLPNLPNGHPKIAVAMDNAFCFYYQDSLDLLEELGAQLVPFSPLNDAQLPPKINGLILGGGYPELYAEALSENYSMRGSIKAAIHGGMPCIAECGGFMYLHKSMQDDTGTVHDMAGVIDADCYKTDHLRRFGYVTLTARRDNMLCKAGENIAAHEFHYWDSTDCGDAFQAQKPVRNTTWNCIYGGSNLNIFAGYPHFHFYSNPRFAVRFIRKCNEFEI
nr:cobyrinate a,c-diamide synthase [uncultured Caproiciproducens sp.]